MAQPLPLIDRVPVLAAWFWSSFGVWMCLEFWVWIRESGGTAGQNRDRGSKIWVIASVWIGIYGAFALMYSAPSGAIRHGALVWFGIGIALIYLGVALRFWAIRTLGRFFRTSVIIQGEHRMITSGPYRVVRNPSYTGAVITAIGIGLAMSNWFSLVAFVGLMLFGYWRRIAVEQEALAEHFGQPYRDYIARTWALIPFVW